MTVSNCGGSNDEGIGEFNHHCSIIGVLVGGGDDAQPDPQGQSSNNIIDGGGIPTNLNVVDKEEWSWWINDKVYEKLLLHH